MSLFFAPYRTVGHVVDSVPFHMKQLGTDTFLTVVVGRAWQVYNIDKLRLSMIGPRLPLPIRAISSVRDITFVAQGTDIVIFRRAEILSRLYGSTTARRRSGGGGGLNEMEEEGGQDGDEDDEDEDDKDIKDDDNAQMGAAAAAAAAGPGSIYLILALGSTVMAIGENQCLDVWDSRSRILSARWSLGDDGDDHQGGGGGGGGSRRATAIEHPNTYLNKVVIAFDHGGMELWNTVTGSKIYRFDSASFAPPPQINDLMSLSNSSSPLASSSSPSPSSGITCVVQSSVIDVVGVGTTSGLIVVHNLKFDKTVMTFTHDREHGSVTCLSFHQGSNAGSSKSVGTSPMLISGSSEGQVAVWDLKQRQLAALVSNAHDARVVSAKFVPNEPLLVTSGADNQLKVWLFDKARGGGGSPCAPRLLRSRSGHRKPPSIVRFYVNSGNHLLSAGADQTLRAFHLYRPQQSMELSQGKAKDKARAKRRGLGSRPLSEVIAFDASEAREREWANIVSCHQGDVAASTWRFSTKALGPRRLGDKPSPVREKAQVTAVCASACGHFAIIGTKSGRVERYNLQSGIMRNSYPLAKSRGGSGKRGHSKKVTGLCVDAVNLALISSGLDGFVKIWNFHEHKLIKAVPIYDLDDQDNTDDNKTKNTDAKHRDGAKNKTSSRCRLPVSKLSLCRASELAACCADDLSVRVVDIRSGRIVRRFVGQHQNKITDLAFSPDGRWLATSCLDGGIRVFDIPSSRLIDWLSFSSNPISLAFSPKGDFLATAHAGNLGIFLWANKSYSSNVYLKGGTPDEPTECDVEAVPVDPDDPTNLNNNNNNAAALATANEEDGRFDFVKMEGMAPKGDGLVTLSGLPTSRWMNLTRLDAIKERNKPIEPPKPPPAAPFFLSVETGLQPKLAPELDDDKLDHDHDQGEAESMSRIRTGFGLAISEFAEVLKKAKKAKQQADGGGKNKENKTNMTNKKKSNKRSRTQPIGEEHDEDDDKDNHDSKVVSSSSLEHRSVTAYLKGLGPSRIDAEIRGLAGDARTERKELALALEYFNLALGNRQDFEFVNALLALFLKVHSDTIAAHSDTLRKKLKALRKTQKAGWRALETQFHYALCMVNSFSGIQQ
mmetsp:Transcript_36817/g.70972  ORF Transcript_36817/g.70972 Transcript_36817/m.70972 type:complete len:1115 (-) Transcript_36817:161-3505(-)